MVASSLAELRQQTDLDLRILILEVGPPTCNNPAHTSPARFRLHGTPYSRTAWVHASIPCEALEGRSAGARCGQCLGGGGSIDGALVCLLKTFYTGWNSNELIPLLRKTGAQCPACTSLCSLTCGFTWTETYRVAGGGPTHGTDGDGPLNVSLGYAQSSSCKSLALLIL
jgi:alcohol oxidase